MFNEKIKTLGELFDKKGINEEKRQRILIFFLLGIFLLLIATPVSDFSKRNGENNKAKQSGKKEESIIISQPDTKNISNDAYISYLENKLEQTIGGMDGAGRVSVMITLKDGGEKILDKNRPYESATDTGKGDGKETTSEKIKSVQETVLVNKDGNTEPIIIKEQYPDVCGVVVLCEGGDNRTLSLQIKEVCGALFSLESHKIVVGKLSVNN